MSLLVELCLFTEEGFVTLSAPGWTNWGETHQGELVRSTTGEGLSPQKMIQQSNLDKR